MKSSGKWVMGAGIALLLAGGGTWWLMSGGNEPVIYTVDTVRRGDLREAINANGEIQARTRVNVGVQVTAVIKTIHVKDGQFVKAGDLLVTLDQEQYRQAVTQAEVGLRMARKDLDLALATFRKQDQTFRRQDALMTSGMISKEDHQQAKLVRDSAEASLGRARLAVQQSEAQLAIAQDALSKTEVRASMAGRITALKAEKGETAIAGQTSIAGAVLMVIADTSELLAEVKVGELDVAKLKVGQPAEIQVDAAPGKVFQGRVLEVATSVDRSNTQNFNSNDTQNYRVRVQLVGEAAQLEALHPGMSARVAILANEMKNVLTVPLQAIQEREVRNGGLGLMSGTRSVVFVVKNGKVEERELKTGAGTRRALEVLSGLSEGDTLLTGPAKALGTLATGAKVRTQTEMEAMKGRAR